MNFRPQSSDCTLCNTGTCRLVRGKLGLRDRRHGTLPLAFIRVAVGALQGSRHQQKRHDTESDVSCWVVCRVVFPKEQEDLISRDMHSSSMLELTYSDSVCLKNIKNGRNDLSLSRLEERILRGGKRYRAQALPCPCFGTSLVRDNHAHLDLTDEADTFSHETVTFCATPDNQQKLTPAVSVSLTFRSANVSESKKNDSSSVVLETQPLLQACIKRQLVGCPVILDIAGGVTTEIRIPSTIAGRRWTLTVRSATACSSASPIISIILPSTRITLLPEETDHLVDTEQHAAPMSKIGDKPLCMSQQQNYSIDLSPAARLLIDTIQCIRLLQSSGSSSTMATPMNGGDIPRTFLFSGPPGTGKTHAVRWATCHEQDCHLIVLQGAEILSQGQHPSEAAHLLERQFHQAVEKTMGQRQRASSLLSIAIPVAVIFLDECDALVGSPDNTNDLTSLALEAALAQLLDRLHTDPAWRRLVVVAATNRVDSIPTSLRRPGRFDREIPLSPPDAATRLAILESLLREQSLGDLGLAVTDVSGRKRLLKIAEACVGYVPADLAALVRRAEILRLTQPQSQVHTGQNETSAVQDLMDRLEQAMSDVGASALRDAALQAPPTTTFDDIAGDPGGAKTALRQSIEWPRLKARAFAALRLNPPRGILLHGPPGCAKTTLARAAASAAGVAFLSLSAADVFSSSYVGDAEAVVRRAFALARAAAPCILFFDEVDAIVGCCSSSGDREGGESHGMGRGGLTNAEARVLSTFLNEMDGVDGSVQDGVLVLGATNRPYSIDAALLRPGRFDKVIYVPPPDYEGRRSILLMQCRHWTIADNEQLDGCIDVDYLASDAVTGNMTGAEIVGACREAAMCSFRDAINRRLRTPVMRQEYLEKALSEVHPLLSNPSVMHEYQSFENRRRRVTG